MSEEAPNSMPPPRLSEGLPQDPTTVAYRRPDSPWKGDFPKVPEASGGPSPIQPKAEDFSWQDPADEAPVPTVADKPLTVNKGEVWDVHSEAPAISIPIQGEEGIPGPGQKVKVFDQQGNFLENYEYGYTTDNGNVVVVKRDPNDPNLKESRVVSGTDFEKWQAMEDQPPSPEDELAKSADKSAETKPNGPENKPTELAAAVAAAEEAAASGDAKAYEQKLAELLKVVKKHGKENGLGEDATLDVVNEVFGRQESQQERRERAAKDMLQFDNVEELRDQIQQAVEKEKNERKAAKNNDPVSEAKIRNEIINKYLKKGTDLQASGSVANYVRAMAELRPAEFKALKEQIPKSKADTKAAKSDVKAEFDPNATYSVLRSDGSDRYDDGYRVSKIYYEEGQAYVDIFKPGQANLRDQSTGEIKTLDQKLTRERIALGQLLEWQQVAKPEKADEEAAKKPKDPTEPDPKPKEPTTEEVVNPFNEEELAASNKRIQEEIERLAKERVKKMTVKPDQNPAEAAKKKESLLRKITKRAGEIIITSAVTLEVLKEQSKEMHNLANELINEANT